MRLVIRAISAGTAMLLLGSGLALAGLPGVELEGSKTADGTYKDLTRVRVADNRDVFVRASNESGDPYDATLMDQATGPGKGDYKLRWFKGDQEITEAVRGSGYEFSVANQDQERFRVRVKVKANNPKRLCFVPLMQGPAFGGNNAFFAINGRNACALA